MFIDLSTSSPVKASSSLSDDAEAARALVSFLFRRLLEISLPVFFLKLSASSSNPANNVKIGIIPGYTPRESFNKRP